jgi:AGZA family xanthine/uracil permease-like MFS transporter
MKATYKTEIYAGLTNFFTMLYIVVVNPAILSTPGTGMSFSGTLTATVLLCFSMTLLMGLYAKIPFAVAPGMGINAFFTFSVIIGKQVPWQTALGMVFWAGAFFLLISLTPARVKIAQAIPKNIRIASAVGIGIFLSFIGLKNAQILAADPVTFVKLAKLGLPSLLSVVGIFIILFFVQRKNPLAYIIGIVMVSLVAGFCGLLKVPETLLSKPDFESVFLKLDVMSALDWVFLPTIFSILFTDLFDSISTLVGVSHSTKLLDKNGDPKNLKQGLVVDAWATFSAALFGTSSGTAYIESSAGIEAGGRTGLTSVVTAFCFLPFLFLAPLAGMIPSYATAPVLIIVGAMMFRCIQELKLEKIEDLVPAFLCIILIPLSFSITQGILWGLLSHVLLYVLVGRGKELSKSLLALAALCAVLLVLEH